MAAQNASRITAATLAALLFSGCATTQRTPMTAYEMAQQECADRAYQATEGLRTTTYVTTALGIIFWPALLIPIVTGTVAVSQEASLREECMIAKGLGPSAPAAAAVASPAMPAAAAVSIPGPTPALTTVEPHL
jgi:hypothetical protein